MNKILIVDDENDILFVLKTYLKSQGYEVRTTLTCEEGLEIFYQFLPNLVILDVNVGSDDGRVICRLIKEQAIYAHIPILLISAQWSNLEDFEVYGANGILKKPFDLQQVLNAVGKYLPKA